MVQFKLNWNSRRTGDKKKEAIFENIIAKNFPKPMKVSSHRFKKPKQTLNKNKRPTN